MKKAAAFVLVVLIATLAYFAMRETSAAREARNARDMAVTERDALRARFAELEKRTEDLASKNTALEAATLRLRETEAAAARTAPPPGMRTFSRTVPRGRMPGPMAMFDSPEMRQLMAVEQKGRLDSRYARLFQSLHLPPDKLDRLKQLLVDKQSAAMDVMAAAHQQDLLGPGRGGAVGELVQQETANLDASIRELLGDTAFEEYQDYERTRAERSVVDRLASRLSYSDSPLSGDQAESLVDLLSAQRATQPPQSSQATGEPGIRVAVAIGGGDTTIGFAGPGSIDSMPITDSTVASAQSVLNEAQLAALLQLQAEQQAQQQMADLFRRSLPPPPPEGGASWVTAPAQPPQP